MWLFIVAQLSLIWYTVASLGKDKARMREIYWREADSQARFLETCRGRARAFSITGKDRAEAMMLLAFWQMSSRYYVHCVKKLGSDPDLSVVAVPLELTEAVRRKVQGRTPYRHRAHGSRRR